MQEDLKKIKKYYGEKMMHLCRELFPTILEEEGRLFSLITSKFPYSRFLYEDIVKEEKEREFQEYIYSLLDKKDNLKRSNEDPFTLMDKAGYILYECNDNNDINFFKKYYSEGEKLCTFRDERYKTHYVFFAVKKDVKDIKREDYCHPQREDKYGRSVISIQFTKGKANVLSIKNRYNHHVDNPDATYNNNLENIIPGLTDSFTKKYNLNIIYNKENFCLNNYILGPDEKFYRFNYEINGIYYCTDNIIIYNEKILKYEKEKYLIIDYYVLDLVNKRIFLYDDRLSDDFASKTFEKIEIINNNSGKIVRLIGKNNITIELDKYNRIIKYNSDIKEINDSYMFDNYTLEEFSAEKLEKVGDSFLQHNNSLKHIFVPNIKEVGDNFLERNDKIKEINLLFLEKTGIFFLRSCNIKEVYFPNLQETKTGFMQLNKSLEVVCLSNLKSVGDYFLFSNQNVRIAKFPNLEKIGNCFMSKNISLKGICLPKTKIIGDSFLCDNIIIENVYLPNVIDIGCNFMCCNNMLKEISLLKTENIGDGFLCRNNSLEKVYLPLVINIGDYFLMKNNTLTEIDFQNVKKIGIDFLYNNNVIQKVIVPNLEECMNNFLVSANDLKIFDFHSIKSPDYFFRKSFLEKNGNQNTKKMIKRL